MYWILEAIISWHAMDQETRVIVVTGTIISLTLFWLIIYSAIKAGMEKALENRAKNQSNYELALQIKSLEKHIDELQKSIPKE